MLMKQKDVCVCVCVRICVGQVAPFCYMPLFQSDRNLVRNKSEHQK